MTILDLEEIEKNMVLTKNLGTVCQNVVTSSRKSSTILKTVYKNVVNNYFVDKTVIVSSNREAKQVLYKVAEQNVFFHCEKT